MKFKTLRTVTMAWLFLWASAVALQPAPASAAAIAAASPAGPAPTTSTSQVRWCVSAAVSQSARNAAGAAPEDDVGLAVGGDLTGAQEAGGGAGAQALDADVLVARAQDQS